MKRIAVILLIVLVSCTQPNTHQIETQVIIPAYNNNDGVRLKVVVVEGCEYFTTPVDRSVIFTHKGNCKNLIHNQK